MAANQPAAPGTSFRATGPAYIATIAIGHGLKHWYIAAFAVFLPLIEEEYALTTTGVALLQIIRQIAGGSPNFFVGYVSDRFRAHWDLLLPLSFLVAATSMMIAGLMPWYWGVVAGIAGSGIDAACRHLHEDHRCRNEKRRDVAAATGGNHQQARDSHERPPHSVQRRQEVSRNRRRNGENSNRAG